MAQANTVEEGHKVRGARREVRGQREIQEMSTASQSALSTNTGDQRMGDATLSTTRMELIFKKSQSSSSLSIVIEMYTLNRSTVRVSAIPFEFFENGIE